MAYELTPSDAHRMTCDTPACKHDCLAPSESDLKEDMALAGWTPLGKDKQGEQLFRCPGCAQGVHPAQAALHAATGGTGVVNVEAPMGVSKGDAFYDPSGDLVGHYTDDAQQGDEVGVKVQLPEPPAPPSAVELYDDMLEGSDEDDDQHGRVSAVAPSNTSSGGRVVHDSVVGASSPGAQYGAEPAGGPDHTSPAATQGLRGGPQLNTAALAETASIFDNLDPSANDWDPDE